MLRATDGANIGTDVTAWYLETLNASELILATDIQMRPNLPNGQQRCLKRELNIDGIAV